MQVALHRLVAVEGIPVVPEVGIPAEEGNPVGLGIPALALLVAANSFGHFFKLNTKLRK